MGENVTEDIFMTRMPFFCQAGACHKNLIITGEIYGFHPRTRGDWVLS